MGSKHSTHPRPGRCSCSYLISPSQTSRVPYPSQSHREGWDRNTPPTLDLVAASSKQHPFTINPTTLTLLPRHIAAHLTLAILTSLIPISAPAQQLTPRTLILLDPAHGGPDTG